MFDKNLGFSYVSLILYCLLTAVSVLSIHIAAQEANLIVLILYVFLTCGLVFNALNFRNIKNTYAIANRDRKSILTLNVLTAIVWLTTFSSLKYLSPALFIIIFMGVIPIVAYITQFIKTKKSTWKELMLISVIAMLVISVIIVHELLFSSERTFMFRGVFLAIIAGISGNFYVLYSRYLQHKLNLVPLEILSLRFYLLIIIGIIWTVSHFSFYKLTAGIDISSVALIALVSNILPLYLLQYGIHNLGPLKTAYMLPLTLVFTYWVELISGIQFEWSLFLLTLLLGIVLSLPAKIENEVK